MQTLIEFWRTGLKHRSAALQQPVHHPHFTFCLVESEPAQSMPLTGVSGHAGSLCQTAGVLLSPLALQELHCAPLSGHPQPLWELGKGLARGAWWGPLP